MVTMNSYIMTSVFGGQDGDRYNDVFGTTKDDQGRFLAVDTSSGARMIDMDHPIQKIIVYSDTVRPRNVCGMNVTYRVAGSRESMPVLRGRESGPGQHVDIGVSDLLLAVYGWTGPIARNSPREAIQSIGFVVFDTRTGRIRTHGPFGSPTNSADGKPFHVTNVVGFGGYHDDQSDIGIFGLFFVKNMHMI